MTSVSSRDAMSSIRSSHSPPVEEVDEPRKKGTRGGKRSVTHLSKAQLARKRANDREAQRNIRQRTKEHIETLERKVKELEGSQRSTSVERIMQRNAELEDEVDKLRAQIAQAQIAQQTTSSPRQVVRHNPEELLIPRKAPLEWMPRPDLPRQWSTGTMRSQNASVSSNDTADAPYTLDDQMYPPPPLPPLPKEYDEQDESQHHYSQTTIPLWNDSIGLSDVTQSYAKPASAWTPFHTALSQPSRFADLQASGFLEGGSFSKQVINTPSFANSTCWQSQPSTYAWRISTKLKAPATLVDQLMLGVINSQRHLHITLDLNGEDLVGPAFPSVNVLLDQPAPAMPTSTLNEVMARYAAVLSNRGFSLIPEKLASFMCMYRFIQWQISPTSATFKALHDWQTPQPSQLTIAHPAWMDLPPWPKFREKVIQDQDRYDNVEFQNTYASNLSVNFPYGPMEALIFENGQFMVSQLMDQHLSSLANMSMKRPFADKYPEFKDVCRFDEVE